MTLFAWILSAASLVGVVLNIRRRKPAEIPRCRCGCKKAAKWPQDGRPLFYSRLCAYLMMVKMFRRKKA